MLEALKSENEKLKIQYNRISSGSSIAEEVIASDKFPVMHDDLYPDDEPTYRSPDQNYQKVLRSPRRDDSMKPEVGGSFRLNDVVEPQPFNYSIIPVHTLLKEQEKHSNPDISEQFEGEGTTTGASASNTLSSDTSEDTDTELMGPKSTPPSAQMDKQCTYKVILPVLDEKLKITGGNFTGIFILEVQLLKSDYSCVSKKEMRTLTLMEARAAFLAGAAVKEKVPDCLPIKKGDILRVTNTYYVKGDRKYWKVCPYDRQNEKWGKEGIIPSEAGAAVKEKVPDCLPIKKGDILRVTNTYYVKGDRKYWKVCPYDRQNEKWGKEGIIPSERGAFRARSLFVRVLPMKASSRLPVLMYGPENIISSAQSLIVDDSPDYLLNKALCNFTSMFLLTGRTVDILRHCINTKGLYRNTISIFGVDKATEYKYNISDDIICETITVGENGVNDKQSFLRAFYEQVQKGQDRMFWCTSSQLDESIVTQFQDYLGRESGDQRAQSQDSGSEGSLLRSTSNPS
uniref:Uncharacterized protein n=1 Tax=Magallana gigas TaxID=29159 RepID=K1QSQ3_MAGGI